MIGLYSDQNSDVLTHWGRVTHICISKLTISGSDNGLPPDRRQAIIWTIAGILLIGPLRTNFSEISIEILTFKKKNAFESVVCETAAILPRPQCVNLNINYSHQVSFTRTCVVSRRSPTRPWSPSFDPPPPPTPLALSHHFTVALKHWAILKKYL